MIQLTIHLNGTRIKDISVSKNLVSIGRSDSNEVILNDPHVSRLAALLEQVPSGYQIVDKSTNGIFLDNQPILETTPLPKHCRLTIYPYEIDYAQITEEETIPLPSLSQKSTSKEHSADYVKYSGPIATQSHLGGMVGESTSMQDLYKLILDVADSPATILIRGEHGTGKELVARALHQCSARSKNIFLPVNCAAIPNDLMESELFGYEKGSFTGASNTKHGKIELGQEGTVFLDEIGELSLTAQATLLRVLQEHTVMRVGGAQEIPVNVRFIAATNRNLEHDIQEGIFREDLYYRLRVVQVIVPPLRERREDLPLLINHFLGKLSQELKLQTKPVVTEQAHQLLQSAAWPGNIRQLENTLYSAILRSRPSYIIHEGTIQGELSQGLEMATEETNSPLEEVNKHMLVKVLTDHQWDTQKAAHALKVSRGTIYYKIKKYGIQMPR